MRRCGQTNFNERDPEVLNIAEWIDYWSSLKLDALLLNAGGILAFYSTKIPYHHKSHYLGAHDLFGDFTKAAKQRGMRVVARMDCNYAYEEAWKAHPEWFELRADGQPMRHSESPWLYKTCMFGSYFTEQMPAILREINSLYDVDGFFTNGWPSTGRPPACHCDNCKPFGDPRSPEYFRRHLERVLAVWKLWDDTAKRKKWARNIACLSKPARIRCSAWCRPITTVLQSRGSFVGHGRERDGSARKQRMARNRVFIPLLWAAGPWRQLGKLRPIGNRLSIGLQPLRRKQDRNT